MKLTCYGASVTAQKGEAGYVQQLTQSNCSKNFSSIEKVAFNASQYEYAGYSFMRDVLELAPNICVIDWLTPAMREFNAFKIDLLNRALLDIDCLPLWVFFPRTDNYNLLPNAYHQVDNSAKKFSLEFINVLDCIPDFSENQSTYLRDSVHTTPIGAKSYADQISSALEIYVNEFEERLNIAKNSKGYAEAKENNHEIPLIKEFKAKIDDENYIEIDFQYKGGFLELFFEAELGPKLCYLDFTLYEKSDVIFEQTFNLVDPWCYYDRSMVIETLRKRMPEGSYKLIIKKKSGNPFLEKNTKKPVEVIINEIERSFEIKRLSLTTSNFNVFRKRSVS